jgi:transposase
MFWAGFGERIRTNLIPLYGNPDAPRGGVDSIVIHALYRAVLPQFVTDGDIFIQDNAPVHRARIIRTLLQQMGIEVMEWPPYSPDLNPIENLWALMKQEIYKLYPELEHAPDNAETLDQLTMAAKEAWHNIRDQVLVRLSSTMPHRVEAVIGADGWYTKY